MLLLCVLLISISSCSVFSVPVVMQFDSSCEWEDLVPGEVKLFIENGDFVIVGTDMNEWDIDNYLEDECVLQIVGKDELSTVIEEFQDDLDAERDQKIRNMNLDRTVKKDILDKDELQDFVERENPEHEWPGGIISPYQLYVTPENEYIIEYAEQFSTIEEFYDESLEWVWISDTDLNGEDEMWLSPEEFLSETADYSTNPTGLIASDCEEQANTLVSLLLASGLYENDEVRVVLGKVDFDGTIARHLFFKLYEVDWWLYVEETSLA